MLIRVTGPAIVQLQDGEPVTAPALIKKLDGASSKETCGAYLDSKLAELGIRGGHIKLGYEKSDKKFFVRTEYSASAKLTAAQLNRLAADTAGQWSDGIGEGCFDRLAKKLGVVIDLLPTAKKPVVEQIDSGKKAAKPKMLVAAPARDGDLPLVRKLLDAGANIETKLQGMSPLNWAVSMGRLDVAKELISRGADIRVKDKQGCDPLMNAALSNQITDAKAARIARELLELGVNAQARRARSYTPLAAAKDRRKHKLVAVLQEFGATK